MAAPTLTALVPDTAAISDANFIIRVQGTGFVSGDVIVWNGGDEPTTFVSETEVTTGVVPSVVSSPTTLPVLVRNAGAEASNELTFTWTAAVGPPPPTDGYLSNSQLPPKLADPDEAWRYFITAATHAIVPGARNGVDFVVARTDKYAPLNTLHWDNTLLGPRPHAAIEAEARRLAAEWPSNVNPV